MQSYTDREQAGKILADELLQYSGVNGVVLGLPRGGVVPAAIIAQKLRLPLDVEVVRKVGAPFNPEYAIGAVSASGIAYLNQTAISLLQIPESQIKSLVDRQSEIAKEREALFRKGQTPLNTKGKVVILVDDGLATGATMKAAIEDIRSQNPAKIIVAVPVGSYDAIEAIANIADLVVCPLIPQDFQAVGQFYSLFPQVEDNEVEKLLRAGNHEE